MKVTKFFVLVGTTDADKKIYQPWYQIREEVESRGFEFFD